MSTRTTPSQSRGRGKRTRRIVRISAYVVVLSAAAWLVGFHLHRPPGQGPAGPSVSREAFSAEWTRRPVLLLGLGDSITEGFGASAGKTYFDRLCLNPPDEFEDMKGLCLSAVIPELKNINRAVSGSTSLDHYDWQIANLPEYAEDVFGVVVITTGGNDIIHDYGRSPPAEGAMYGATFEQAEPWIMNFEKRLDAMLDLIAEKFPGGCEIFIGNIYDPTDGAGTAKVVGLPKWPDGLRVLAAYNDIIERSAKARPNVHRVDLHSAFMGHGITCRQFWRKTYRKDDPHYWFFENFEDPNDRGYDAARRLFLIEMACVLPARLRRVETPASSGS